MSQVRDWMLDPDLLWRSTGLGREEYVQKLLSTLIFGHGDHRWNIPGAPSIRGRQFIRGLEAVVGSDTPGDPQFVDEFELPRRHDDEHAGWPDQAAIWDEALLLIELKTEKRSHRPGQLAHYLDLAVHHHPGRVVSLLYLTPTMEPPAPQLPEGTRYAHTSWAEVAPLIREIWAESDDEWERRVCDRLLWWLDEVEAQRPLPPREVPAPDVVSVEDLVEMAIAVASEVEATGEQGVVDAWPGEPERLESARIVMRERLREDAVGLGLTHVLPWLWSGGTSGGSALSEAGRVHGYELRLSRYAKDLWG